MGQHHFNTEHPKESQTFSEDLWSMMRGVVTVIVELCELFEFGRWSDSGGQ
jgi:hypothetical protein